MRNTFLGRQWRGGLSGSWRGSSGSSRHSSHGFTLIELVIALAVLALLVTLAAPSFGARLTAQRLYAAADGLALDFAEARFQAGQSARTLHVTFSPGADWCYAVTTRADCPCGTANACVLKAVHARDLPGVTLAQASDAEFDPAQLGASGRTSGGAEWLSSGGERLRVSVSPLGRPKVCSLNGQTRFAAC